MPCYTCAVIKDEDEIYFFDSHSRGDTGMLAQDGAACMSVHKKVDDLCLFIRHLASSLKLKDPIPFEVASLEENFKEQGGTSSSDSDFSGLNPVSNGEYTCKLPVYLAQEVVKSAMNSSSDFSPLSNWDDLSDSSQLEHDSSKRSQCVQSINESSSFINTIDTECLSDVADSGHGDDDDDDESDDDYNADETYGSSESEDVPLARIKRMKKSKQKSKFCW